MSYDLLPCGLYGGSEIERSPDHWWVTTCIPAFKLAEATIERSPDHWWVTTNASICAEAPKYWKVTRSLVSYDDSSTAAAVYPTDWKVTRSLVSYDQLRHHRQSRLLTIERSPDHWWVTTPRQDFLFESMCIERSPDHWWVTTQPKRL